MLLDKFLHKTVASSVAYRYQKIDEMVTVLKELIEVSDISSTFLFHNFLMIHHTLSEGKMKLAGLTEYLNQDKRFYFYQVLVV